MSIRFSGNTKETVYNIVTKTGDTIGVYNQLYGGFYQGFFKLFGYDYETFPTRTNEGWTVEMLVRPRYVDQFAPTSAQTTLNLTYPQNENTFFYFGTRAENKFYHHASGSPVSDSGYTRVTSVLEGCLETCACSNTGVTNSRCIEVYEPLVYTAQHNTECNCGCNSITEVPNGDKDPLYDSMSNSFSLRLSGDPKNPKVCVKVLTFTGGCITTGTCPTTGITYQTGYTITEYCSSNQIFDYCENLNADYTTKEHWILVDCVWERNTYFDTCDLYYRGGLGLISDTEYVDSLSNNSILLIQPPITHEGSPPAEQVEIVNLNERWLIEREDRLGVLKIYINGRLFYVINGFEEVIPRALNTEKEKQLGVPFNISWGGGTQGLRESLTFTECPTSLTGLTYQQDPECMPNETLSGTSLSALTTNILIEPTFGGSFDGAISQFRMYTEPLTYPEVIHNFDILKSSFLLFDYGCPDCSDGLLNDICELVDGNNLTFTSENLSGYSFDLYYNSSSSEPRFLIAQSEGFPFTVNRLLLPNCCSNEFYFYFPALDQTLIVNCFIPNVPIYFDLCSVFYVSISTEIFYYNVTENTSTLLPVPSNTNNQDIAHTQNKLWTISRYTDILEWNITLNPFSATLNRSLTQPFNLSPGLAAIDDFTLIVGDLETPQNLYELDITTNTPTSTLKVTLPTSHEVAGDVLLTTTNKLLVLTVNTIDYTFHLLQYNYTTSSLELDITLTTYYSPFGIFQNDGDIYVNDSGGNIYLIDTVSPYTTHYVQSVGRNITGASQVPSCLTTNFIV